MSERRHDDGIWDEHQWETYLNEIEQRSQQLRKFIASDRDESFPRWLALLKENPDVFDAVDAYIEEELQIEDAYFPDEEDWDDDEIEDFFWEELEEDDFFLDEFEGEDEEDFDEGEEWKELSADFAQSENGSIENLSVYLRARDLSVGVLERAESIHPKLRTEAFSDFVSNTLKIGAKLAGAYSFGFELDYLGANIACTKKALYAANEALFTLEDHLKETPIFPVSQYPRLHEEVFILRNDIGIYVQELREQFNLGFE
jgi:hypothetical protein